MDTAREHFKNGTNYYYNDDFEYAAREFEHAIRLDRQNDDYYYWCGLAYYDNKDYDEAIEKFEQAIELNNTKGDYYYSSGKAYYKNGNYDSAIKRFEDAISISDNDDECFFLCGRSYYNNENYDKAIEKFKQAIKINNTNEKFFYWCGLALYNNGNSDGAIEMFGNAINIDNTNPDYFYQRGISYYNSENSDYVSAIENFEHAIELSDNNDEYYYWCGLAYQHNEEYDAAIEKFEKAIKLNDKDANYFYFCGLSYFYIEKYNEAERMFVSGIKLSPDDLYYYYRELGNLKIKINDYNSARYCYELALENAENDDQKNSINDKILDLGNIDEDNIDEDDEITDENEEEYVEEDFQKESAEEDDSYHESQNRDNNLNINSISKFGIDFGTTNSALVSITGSGSNNKIFNYGDEAGYPMPSLVAINKKDGKVFTGSEVKDNLVEYLSEDYYYFESIKSIINSSKEWEIAGKIYTPIDVAAELFKALYKKVEDRGDRIDNAIVAIPVGFTSKEKECLRQAAQKADFEIKMFVSEPTAAFCSNYKQLKVKNNVVVFDWGGGTLDISVLNVRNGRVSEVATGGIKLAGDDIDKKLAEQAHKYFCDKHPECNDFFDKVSDEMKFLLLARSERAKCNFSDQNEVSIKLNNYLGSQLRYDISYEQFRNLIENEIDKAIECLEKTITKANLNTETLDCILCVGGSSNLRPLQEKLKEKYNNKVFIPEATGWNIAKGAAIIAGRPGKFALSRPIGLVLSDDSFLTLLEAGQPIPCNGAPPITFALTEGKPNEDKSAKFVFADAEYEADRTFSEYKTVPVRAFDDEKITLSYYVDPNFTFKAKIETNKKLPESLWVHDKLNVYYQIEDSDEDV